MPPGYTNINDRNGLGSPSQESCSSANTANGTPPGHTMTVAQTSPPTPIYQQGIIKYNSNLQYLPKCFIVLYLNLRIMTL